MSYKLGGPLDAGGAWLRARRGFLDSPQPYYIGSVLACEIFRELKMTPSPLLTRPCLVRSRHLFVFLTPIMTEQGQIRIELANDGAAWLPLTRPSLSILSPLTIIPHHQTLQVIGSNSEGLGSETEWSSAVPWALILLPSTLHLKSKTVQQS